LSTPRILKLPTIKAGYKVSHRFKKKSGAFSPQPRKTTKISATTSEEGTWKSLKYWPPDGSTYARACYETQTVAGPSIHIFHTVIFAFILKHLKTKFCRFTVAWNFPIVTGLYFNFTNFQSKEVGGKFLPLSLIFVGVLWIVQNYMGLRGTLY